MSGIEPERQMLARHRLQRSEEILEEARVLLAAGHRRGAVDRHYYAMFHAARALLALKGMDSSKHSGVIAMFNREFVKTGELPKEMGKKLKMAFDLRIESD